MERFGNAGFSFEVTDTPSAGGGGAGQVAVLLHGFPEDRHSWDAVAPALAAAGYRVLAPDQRGYSPGARPAARSAYTLSKLAGDVLLLADAAGAERFHLVGHDWGGALAWYVAAFQLPGLPELALSRRGGEAMRAALVRTGLDPGSAARYAARGADPAALRGPLNWYRAIPLGLRERTGRIEVPTLFMWSDGDRFVSRAAAELCGRYVSGPYRFEVLEGASHWLPEEVPERVAALLVAHFARTSGG